MKKIGLIGGTGYESTLIYYRELNRRLVKASGNKAFPEIIIESLNLYKIFGFINAGNYTAVEKYLLPRLNNLEKSGAKIVAMTAATMHMTYDHVKDKVNVPFISIPETAGEYAAQKGYKKIGMLGTVFTMEHDYLSKAFINRGIDVIVPNEQQRKTVGEIVINELEFGIVKPESVAVLLDIIKEMQEQQGIEAIILGCTELPLALNNDNSPIPCLDVMELHIEKLVELAKD